MDATDGSKAGEALIRMDITDKWLNIWPEIHGRVSSQAQPPVSVYDEMERLCL